MKYLFLISILTLIPDMSRAQLYECFPLEDDKKLSFVYEEIRGTIVVNGQQITYGRAYYDNQFEPERKTWWSGVYEVGDDNCFGRLIYHIGPVVTDVREVIHLDNRVLVFVGISILDEEQQEFLVFDDNLEFVRKLPAIYDIQQVKIFPDTIWMIGKDGDGNHTEKLISMHEINKPADD